MDPSYDAATDGRRFLGELFRDADTGYVAVTAFTHGRGTTSFRPADRAVELWDAIEPTIGTADIYVRLTSMVELPEHGKRGGNAHTLHGFALPIDLDGKDGWTPQLAGEFFARLEAVGLKVSVLIISGYGWHGYLLLDEPLEAPDHVRMLERAKATMLRLSAEIGRAHGIELTVDPKVYDAARVMRIPGTLNVKSATPVPCRTVEADYDRRYSWSQLDEALDEPAPLRIERKAYAVGGADDPNAGAPGREFNAGIDGADLFLELFPGFYVTHVDSDGNVYIARPDRRNHGVVRYADDGHIAIYSATTLRDMGIAAGSPDDKNGPWWPFNLLALRTFGGDFSAAARHLSSTGWHGRTYGSGDSAAAAAKQAQFDELTALLTAPAAPPAAPQPVLQPVPGTNLAVVADPEHDQADDPQPEPPAFEWGPGRIDAVDILTAFGFEVAQQVGQMTMFRATMLDGGLNVAATVQPDATVVLGQVVAAVFPGAPIGQQLTWQQLLEARFGASLPQLWAVITGPDELPADTAPMLLKLRDAVQGIEGVGRVEPEPFVWATADEIIARPKPPATLLARADGACLVYENRISTVFGASGTTKTWLAAYAALDCIRRLQRPVMWIDIEEPGNSQGAYRLAQLGASHDELRMLINLDSIMPEIIQVEFGQRTVKTALRDKLVAKAIEWQVGLIVIDSFSELAGSQDLDDNQKRDVAYLRNHLLQPLAKAAGLIIIDHTGHSTGAREAGTVNKRNAIDGVRIYVEQVQRFAPGFVGEARLWVLKDRHTKVLAHCTRTAVEWDRVKSTEYLAGTLVLRGVPGAARTASDDEIVDAVLRPPGLGDMVDAAPGGPAGTSAPSPSGSLPGKDTTSVDMLVEMALRGAFKSERDAVGRMRLTYGTGEDRTKTLLRTLQQTGDIIEVGGNRGSKGYAVSKAPNSIVEQAVAARRRFEDEQARRERDAEFAAAESEAAEQALQTAFEV